MAAKRKETETAVCYICPLCAKTILHQKDHLRDYHNFKDEEALQNFMISFHFVFEKVVIEVVKERKEENVTESAKMKTNNK